MDVPDLSNEPNLPEELRAQLEQSEREAHPLPGVNIIEYDDIVNLHFRRPGSVSDHNPAASVSAFVSNPAPRIPLSSNAAGFRIIATSRDHVRIATSDNDTPMFLSPEAASEPVPIDVVTLPFREFGVSCTQISPGSSVTLGMRDQMQQRMADSMPWMRHLNDVIYPPDGIPQVVVGPHVDLLRRWQGVGWYVRFASQAYEEFREHFRREFECHEQHVPQPLTRAFVDSLTTRLIDRERAEAFERGYQAGHRDAIGEYDRENDDE